MIHKYKKLTGMPHKTYKLGNKVPIFINYTAVYDSAATLTDNNNKKHFSKTKNRNFHSKCIITQNTWANFSPFGGDDGRLA